MEVSVNIHFKTQNSHLKHNYSFYGSSGGNKSKEGKYRDSLPILAADRDSG